LQLGILQSEAARRLGVSIVTLSRWECDKVYPTWPQQTAVAAYLGCDPFTNPALGSPKSNETSSVALLSPEAPSNIGQAIIRHCLKAKKTRKQLAKELDLSPKTIRNWEMGRRQPSDSLLERVLRFLGSDRALV
jgi:transcriptional regulator with XRE-family HTH domain